MPSYGNNAQIASETNNVTDAATDNEDTSSLLIDLNDDNGSTSAINESAARRVARDTEQSPGLGSAGNQGSEEVLLIEI